MAQQQEERARTHAYILGVESRLERLEHAFTTTLPTVASRAGLQAGFPSRPPAQALRQQQQMLRPAAVTKAASTWGSAQESCRSSWAGAAPEAHCAPQQHCGVPPELQLGLAELQANLSQLAAQQQRDMSTAATKRQQRDLVKSVEQVVEEKSHAILQATSTLVQRQQASSEVALARITHQLQHLEDKLQQLQQVPAAPSACAAPPAVEVLAPQQQPASNAAAVAVFPDNLSQNDEASVSITLNVRGAGVVSPSKKATTESSGAAGAEAAAEADSPAVVVLSSRPRSAASPIKPSVAFYQLQPFRPGGISTLKRSPRLDSPPPSARHRSPSPPPLSSLHAAAASAAAAAAALPGTSSRRPAKDLPTAKANAAAAIDVLKMQELLQGLDGVLKHVTQAAAAAAQAGSDVDVAGRRTATTQAAADTRKKAASEAASSGSSAHQAKLRQLFKEVQDVRPPV